MDKEWTGKDLMNVVIISPDFPHINVNLCEQLSQAGIRTLGIGDASYDILDQRLKDALTEYYYVPSLDTYDAVYRGIAFFSYKYGKIDILESNNPYWLTQDAQLRRDFNITSGPQECGSDADNLARITAAGLPTGGETGYLLSYDALVGHDGEIIVEGGTQWPTESAMDYTYRTLPVSDDMRSLGRQAISAIEARDTFVHIQMFHNGHLSVARVSRSAPPAFTLDMLNHSQSLDSYWAYAVELANRDPNLDIDYTPEHRYQTCVYASRQQGAAYELSSQDIEARYADHIRQVAQNPEQYRHGMGDFYYLAVFDSDTEADQFARDVTSRASE